MEWKPVKGYEELYKISEYGDVIRTKKYKNSKDTPLKTFKDKDGYLKVCLCKNNNNKTWFVHRLVALAFLENKNGYNVINHKDENKTNNHFSNLEWCTIKYNTNHGTGIERRAEKRRKKVIAYNDKCSLFFNSITEAETKTKIRHGNISMCLSGKRRTAGGYKWKYAS